MLTKLNLKNRLLLQLFKAAVVVVVEVVVTMEAAIVEVTILDNRHSHHQGRVNPPQELFYVQALVLSKIALLKRLAKKRLLDHGSFLLFDN